MPASRCLPAELAILGNGSTVGAAVRSVAKLGPAVSSTESLQHNLQLSWQGWCSEAER